MRFLFISPEFHPFSGGIANATLDLALELINQGHQVEIITKKTKNQKPFEIYKNIIIHRVSFIKKKFFENISFIIFSLLKTSTIRNQDIIYAQTIYPSGLISSFIKLFYRKKTIVHARGADINYNLFYGNKLLKLFSLFSLKTNDLIFTLSNDHAKKISFLKNKKIYVVPNGVKKIEITFSKKSLRNNFNFPKNKYHIIFVGRLEKWKGIYYLTEMSKKLSNKYCIHIIGIGSEYKNIKRKYENEIRNKRIILHKKVKREKVFEFMKASDVMIYPDLRAQGLSNTVLEAMMLKLPIIGINKGYFKDIIIHNYNGLLIKNVSSDEISKYTKKLLRDKSLSKKIKNNAYNLVNNKYRWKNIVNKITKIINSFFLSNE